MEKGVGEGIDPDDRFVIDGLEFVPSWSRASASGSLTLLKAGRMVDRYRQLLDAYPNPRMVELGISQGGSVALLALMARPTKFVAVELASDPVEPLLAALRERGLDQTVKPYFGVDQGDKGRLDQILAAEFEGADLDVVIDDASHLYGPTVASFEVLFPRLRPGGVYVIEDWNWHDIIARGTAEAVADPGSPGYDRFVEELQARMTAALADPGSPGHDRLVEQLEAQVTAALADPGSPGHDALVRQIEAQVAAADAQPDSPGPDRIPRPRPPAGAGSETPLSRLALELALARAHSGGAVVDVHLDQDWIVVHRGDATIDPDGFRVGDLYPDAFSLLTPRPEGTA